eukprot:1955601-Rhodomonas_salina.1
MVLNQTAGLTLLRPPGSATLPPAEHKKGRAQAWFRLGQSQAQSRRARSRHPSPSLTPHLPGTRTLLARRRPSQHSAVALSGIPPALRSPAGTSHPSPPLRVLSLSRGSSPTAIHLLS